MSPEEVLQLIRECNAHQVLTALTKHNKKQPEIVDVVIAFFQYAHGLPRTP